MLVNPVLVTRASWLEKHAELYMLEKLLLSVTSSQTWTCNSIRRRQKMEVTWQGRSWLCGFGTRLEGLRLWSTDAGHSWPALEIFINFWLLFWGLPGWLWKNCALGSPWSPKQFAEPAGFFIQPSWQMNQFYFGGDQESWRHTTSQAGSKEEAHKLA